MPPKIETLADNLFYGTVFIEAWNSEGSWTGTGFVIGYETADMRIPVLVTNRHVLGIADAATFHLVAADADGQAMAARVSATIENLRAFVVDHPEPQVDIAAMLFAYVGNTIEGRGEHVFLRSFDPVQLATQDQVEQLDSIESVLFLGYPNGLYDSHSMLPIARRGDTATPIRNDYRGEPAFLIDAAVFPGSSGSPVVLYDTSGVHTTRDGRTMVGKRFHLLGVLAALHTRQVAGEVVELPARSIAIIDDPLNLGIVYKSSAIQECIDRLFYLKGVPLTETPASADLA